VPARRKKRSADRVHAKKHPAGPHEGQEALLMVQRLYREDIERFIATLPARPVSN
jgi:hypothetical protein